jgi:hypothetical protein
MGGNWILFLSTVGPTFKGLNTSGYWLKSCIALNPPIIHVSPVLRGRNVSVDAPLLRRSLSWLPLYTEEAGVHIKQLFQKTETNCEPGAENPQDEALRCGGFLPRAQTFANIFHNSS